ncbi:hypothetical protein NF867_09190 [Solitalea sp. MAHUQ-68]|uniref:Uncharacterized protein n=1 Tax=Solitalea agri TaxID=2953739 RepID=A0A9X2JF46_9SPHI|nr:hypothetical protein [Solitalea agri]MCO4293036.1 hypothetical protein [Solitalea agri]
MNKDWTINDTLKVIGVFQVVIGITILIYLIWLKMALYNNLSQLEGFKVSSLKFFFILVKDLYIPFLLDLLITSSGIALLLNKRIGWQAAMVSSLLNAALLSIYIFLSWGKNTETIQYGVVFALIYYIMFFSLLSKPIQLKFSIQKNQIQ